MFSLIARFTRWLHTQWPAGVVEKLPQVNDDGSTNIPGVYIVGDLTGIPLLKFSSDTGARAVHTILKDSAFAKEREKEQESLDLAIVGAGVAGMAAAMEANQANVNYKIFEASEVFSTVVNFPRRKPIYTYPTEMTPAGGFRFEAEVKEDLLEEMEQQRQQAGVEVEFSRISRVEQSGRQLTLHHEDGSLTHAKRVIIAIGRSGNFRTLDCPGEELDKVSNRLHDPKDFAGKNILVVGGGDSALETTIALVSCGAYVTLSYRRDEFSRPKPENIEKLYAVVNDPESYVNVERPSSERVSTSASSTMRGDTPSGKIQLELGTEVQEIQQEKVILKSQNGETKEYPNDFVFSMIGREAPLDFFRRSGIKIANEWTLPTITSFAAFVLFCTFLYHWKSGGSAIYNYFVNHNWFPFNMPQLLSSLGDWVAQRASDPTTLLGTLQISMQDPGFFYTFVYSLVIVIFGISRIRRKKTPYIKVQTLTLMAFQVLPLFLLPTIILPWLGYNGYFASGWGKYSADQLFPENGLIKLHTSDVNFEVLASKLSHNSQDPAAEFIFHKLSLQAQQTLSSESPDKKLILQDLNRLMAEPNFAAASFWSQKDLPPYLQEKRQELTAQPAKGEPLYLGNIALFSALYPQAVNKKLSYHTRAYWRAYGLILAWPLFIWNVFSSQPYTWWLVICFAQTFVIIPWIVMRWGKGAYCGWICSCGALAETLGDKHRHKMPHGPFWNRLNMLGQVILWIALLLMVLRMATWLWPVSFLTKFYQGMLSDWKIFGFGVNYKYIVDLWLAGIVGLGCYFWLSGRVWCRFACPLAALMHIYARFGKFRIFSEKSKCISCNVCTSVCHQGIDVMNFANKGLPMNDPECVRCSACVEQCPTGVLSFGRFGKDGKIIFDRLGASPVQMREKAQQSK